MGPTLEARLYTLEMLCSTTFDVSRQLQNEEKVAMTSPSPMGAGARRVAG